MSMTKLTKQNLLNNPQSMMISFISLLKVTPAVIKLEAQLTSIKYYAKELVANFLVLKKFSLSWLK
jgi:hypothetical protein